MKDRSIMKVYGRIITTLFLTSIVPCYAQIVGQDSNSFSSIIEASASINLDINNNLASLSFYRDYGKKEVIGTNDNIEGNCILKSTRDSVKNCLECMWEAEEKAFREGDERFATWGFEVKGSSSGGVGTVIRNEEITTGSSAGLFLGINWRTKNYDSKESEKLIDVYNSKRLYDNGVKVRKAIIERELESLRERGFLSLEEKKAYMNLQVKFTEAEKSKIEDLQKLRNKLVGRKVSILERAESKIIAEDRIKLLDSVKDLAQFNYEAIIDSTLTRTQIFERIESFQLYYGSEEVETLKLKLDISKPFEKYTWKDIVDITRASSKQEAFNLYVASKRSDPKALNYIISCFDEYISFINSFKADFGKANNIAGNGLYAINTNLIYSKIAFTGSSFTYEQDSEATSKDERFEDKDFQGYRLELGYTRNYRKNNYLGFNFALNRTNNVNSLTSTTFKFQKDEDNISQGALVTSTEIKALSGDYKKFLRYDLSFDYAYLLAFNNGDKGSDTSTKSQLLLSINPYVRHQFYGVESGLKPSTSIGAGAFAFNTNNGSIAGGVFLQLNDLFNQNSTPVESVTKKINFGIVVKANLKSFNPLADNK